MSAVSDLLQQHFETLVADNARWQTLIADEIVWELPYAPAIGHPERLSGREAVVRHVTWFLGAVEKFRFSDVRVHAFADPAAAVAEVKAEALIKPTGRVTVRSTRVPLCQGREDHFSSRVLRPGACGQGAGRADRRSPRGRSTFRYLGHETPGSAVRPNQRRAGSARTTVRQSSRSLYLSGTPPDSSTVAVSSESHDGA